MGAASLWAAHPPASTFCLSKWVSLGSDHTVFISVLPTLASLYAVVTFWFHQPGCRGLPFAFTEIMQGCIHSITHITVEKPEVTQRAQV